MLTLTKQFGGLSNRAEAHLIGPTLAQDLSNVNLDSQGIRPINGLGSTVTSGSGTLRSLWKFGSNWITSTEARQYVEAFGKLFYAVSGGEPKKSADGSTFYKLGIANPGSTPSAAAGAAGNVTGTITYVVTFVSTLGGESGPSAASGAVTVTSQQIDLTNIPVSADPQVVARKLYRLGGTTAYQLVTTINDNTTTIYTDNVADASLGNAIVTTDFTAPGNLQGLCVAPYGRLFGWDGRSLYWTYTLEEGNGHPYDAWSAEFLSFTENIKAVVPFSGSLLVLTEAQPYLVTGTDGDTFAITSIPSQQGCVERDTAIDMGDSVFYLSPDGVCAFTGSDVTVISRQHLSDAFMAAISATNAKAVRYNERYLLFHSGGYLEHNRSIPGSPWLKGTITANAVHYNRTADALYVASVADVKQWEAGSAATFSYKTGDWTPDPPSSVKHWAEFALLHDGENTVKVYLKGALHGTTYTLTTTEMDRSRWLIPMAGWGTSAAVEVGGTGTVRSILANPTVMENV